MKNKYRGTTVFRMITNNYKKLSARKVRKRFTCDYDM